MSVFVDGTRAPGQRGGVAGLWSRLSADSPDELHAFARRIGLPREWYVERCADDRVGYCPHWHYSINEVSRAKAVVAGAVPVDAVRFTATLAGRSRVVRP